MFVGSGATAAVELLVHLLDLSAVVVVHGIQEHHSNLLPWTEISQESFAVRETEAGDIDVVELCSVLTLIREKYGQNMTILGCFTAASNITGIIMNVEEVNAILIK